MVIVPGHVKFKVVVGLHYAKNLFPLANVQSKGGTEYFQLPTLCIACHCNANGIKGTGIAYDDLHLLILHSFAAEVVLNIYETIPCIFNHIFKGRELLCASPE